MDDRVATTEAAKLWGCSRRMFLSEMAEAGVEPEVRQRPHPHGGFCRVYYWHPSDVLRVRAEHKLAKAERRLHVWKNRPKPGTKPFRRASTLARASLHEFNRLRILQRVAKREGTTVQKLVIDKGLQDWYRSLPPKHREEA